MRPSEFEAIRSTLERAVNAINAYFEKATQLREIAKELEGEFNWQADAPERAPSEVEEKDAPRSYSYTGKPVRPHPLIEWAYPWRHSAKQAARDLYDCGWNTEAKAIVEVLNDLPTEPVDGNHPEILERQLNAIRAGAEQVRKILAACLKEQAPAAPESQPPAVEPQDADAAELDLTRRLDLAEFAFPGKQKEIFQRLRDMKPHNVKSVACPDQTDEAALKMLGRMANKLLGQRELRLELGISGSNVFLKELPVRQK